MSDERGEMTPWELDDLASAYLDGEATVEEDAFVESDPRLQALVEELQAVRDLVAIPVEPPSDEVRDQMVAQALTHRAPVVSLEKARRRLRSIPPRARVILATAAVVAAFALVGVTVFERANRDGADTFASDDDSAAAPEAAGDTAMEALASAPEPESEAPAEEAMMDWSESASDDAGEAGAPAEPEEAIMADELAAVPERPDSSEEEFVADEGPMEAPAEDSAEAEPAAAAETEVMTTSEEALSWYETEADLVAHVVVLAHELAEASGTSRDDEPTPVDLMGCPLFPDEEFDLLTRFDAIVEGAEAQVSVYLDDGELRFTQTTPPPECELFNSHIITNWP